MTFQDNILKAYLKNVYFIAGTPCGGKTTVTAALSAQYGIPVYNADAMFSAHQGKSDSTHQPCMNRTFPDADAFFGRSVSEYREWLVQNTREQLDFVLLDLIRLSQYGRLLCDCHLTPEQAELLSEPQRVAFMIREPVSLAEEYSARPDHADFRRYLYSASDPEHAKAVCSETLFRLHDGFYRTVRNGRWFFVDRAEGLSAAETAARTAAHFGLSAPRPAEIVRVEQGSHLAAELADFMAHCSWEETREHIVTLIREWRFAEREAVFAAVTDGRIVGMAALMQTDYYPLPDVFPWVTCIFVTEAFRGQGICRRLIDSANACARSLGYEKTYIPSPFLGLYERYGYRYLRDIVNYGGGTDHLFVRAV